MAQDKFQRCKKCGRLNLGTWCICPDWNKPKAESLNERIICGDCLRADCNGCM